MQEVDYRRVANQLQLENEELRLQLFALRNRRLIPHLELDVNMPAVISWIEQHYMFCIVLLLGMSYLLGFLVDAYETHRRFK